MGALEESRWSFDVQGQTSETPRGHPRAGRYCKGFLSPSSPQTSFARASQQSKPRYCAPFTANTESNKMSTKKRRNDSSQIALAMNEVAQTNAEASPIASGDDESNWRDQLAAMRAQRDSALAQKTAAQADNERLRAAALAPCPRCNFHAWTVRVQTMAGQVHSIACPDGPATLIAHVKKELVQFDPKFHIQQQLTLVLSCDVSSSSSSGSDGVDPIPSALADDRTLASCGVSNGNLLDLFVVDMDWDKENLAIIERIRHGGDEINFVHGTRISDDNEALPWALVNAVCRL
jgi:hypothetical protein